MESSDRRQPGSSRRADASRPAVFRFVPRLFSPDGRLRRRPAPTQSGLPPFQRGYRPFILALAWLLTLGGVWQERFAWTDICGTLLATVLLLLMQLVPVAWTRERPLTFTAPVVFALALWMSPPQAALAALLALLFHARYLPTAGRPVGYMRFQGAQLALSALLAGAALDLAARWIQAPLSAPLSLSLLIRNRDLAHSLLAASSFAALVFALANGLLTAVANLGTLRSFWRAADRQAHSIGLALVYLLGMLPVVLLAPMGTGIGPIIGLPLLFLLLLCGQVARLKLENESLRDQLESAKKMGHASVATSDHDIDPTTLLERFLHLANGLVASDRAVVWTMNQETMELTPTAALPSLGEFEGRKTVFGEGLIGHAAGRWKPRLISDASRDRHRAPNESAAGAWLLYPIVVHERVLGVSQWVRPKSRPFTSDDVARLHALVPMAAVALENVRVREAVFNLAATDGLTGLWNHRRMHDLLREEMRRATRYLRALSVMMLDVDSFKSFNDTYGHPQGDELLRSIASILRANVRSVDHVGRYGGEEFLVLLPETDKDAACRLAERIRGAVEERAVIIVDGREIRRTVSVGVASYPEDALNPAELVQRADEALYRAKRAGKNRVLWA